MNLWKAGVQTRTVPTQRIIRACLKTGKDPLFGHVNGFCGKMPINPKPIRAQLKPMMKR